MQSKRVPLSVKLGKFSWPMASVFISMLVVFPLISLIYVGLAPTDDIWSHLVNTVLSDYISTSLSLMFGVALCTTIIGVSSAYMVTHFRFPGSRWLGWALLLPLAVPTYIIAYSYTGLLDIAGPLQYWLRDTFDLKLGEYWFPNIRSLNGAIFVMSFVLYPYVYLLARAAFLEQSSNLIDAARLLGISRSMAFIKVSMPIARPAIVAGVSLALMETLADYGAVSYFGLSTFTTGIFRTWYGLDSVAGAAQLALILLSFVVILIYLEKKSRRRQNHQSRRIEKSIDPIKISGLKGFALCALAFFPVLLGFVIPLLQLAIWAASRMDTLFSPDFHQLVINSFTLAAITATIAVVLALVLSYAVRLSPNSQTRLFAKKMVSLGYAVPGTVIAVGVIMPLAAFDNAIDAWFRATFSYSTGLILSGTIFALIIAYLVRFMAVALGPVDSGVNSIHTNLDQAARSLGQQPLGVVSKVHIPLLKTSLITAALIVFVDVMKELPATLILRPFNFNTLAVRAYELASDERLADASLASISIVAAGLVPVILLIKSSDKST